MLPGTSKKSRRYLGYVSTRAMAAVWSTSKVVSLIALYEERPCLYETTSKDYFNRDLRSKALQEIVENLGGEFSGKQL